MSGETLEDYFRHLNLDESRRKYLESIKEGKQVDKEIEELAATLASLLTGEQCANDFLGVINQLIEFCSTAAAAVSRSNTCYTSSRTDAKETCFT